MGEFTATKATLPRALFSPAITPVCSGHIRLATPRHTLDACPLRHIPSELYIAMPLLPDST